MRGHEELEFLELATELCLSAGQLDEKIDCQIRPRRDIVDPCMHLANSLRFSIALLKLADCEKQTDDRQPERKRADDLEQVVVHVPFLTRAHSLK